MICDHCADWWPHWATKQLVVVHPLISEISFSKYKFQQVCGLQLHEGSCFIPSIRLLAFCLYKVSHQPYGNGSEKWHDMKGYEFLIISSLLVMNTNSASSVEFCIVYWLSTCKVLRAFVKYLIDTWYVDAPMKLFIGFRGDMTQLLQQDYEMVVIWLSLHLINFWNAIKRWQNWISQTQSFLYSSSAPPCSTIAMVPTLSQ